MYKYLNDYQSRDDLLKFGANSLLLYALQLRFNIDDIETVASDSITDGYEDKKCDLIYVDDSNGIAVIAQAYIKNNFHEGEHAKLTKAQDLNTAATWVIGRDEEDIPDLLKSAVISLREAIGKNEITTLYFWYQHNCDEFKDIQDEMNSVSATANALLKQFYPEQNVNVIGLEVGNQTLEKWYDNTTNKILVNDRIEIDLPFGGYEISGDNWSSYQAYISGKELYRLYNKYSDDLLSANPRRFLGIGRKTNIINLGIKESALKSPENFLVYNNGITALVHNYDASNAGKLILLGMSIINGAQTTGSIGSLDAPPSEKLYVSIRFIKCSDKTTIDAIIANNNRQNEMVPSDFRSNDICQTRLRSEFSKYPQLFYNGGQRNNLRPRSREVFDPDTVAQILLAFNGNPVDAYSSRKDVWINDQMYASIFSDELHAEHIIYVYSLSKTIDDMKSELLQESKNGTAILERKKQLAFLCKRGSRILLLAAIAHCLEIILQKPISSMTDLKFDDCTQFAECKRWWKPCVAISLSFYGQLVPALSAGGLDSKAKVTTAIAQFSSMMNAILSSTGAQLKEFRVHSEW
jgi:hypothetical protein